MSIENNIEKQFNTITQTNLKSNLLSVKDDHFKEVGTFGRLWRAIIGVFSDNAFSDCKSVKVAKSITHLGLNDLLSPEKKEKLVGKLFELKGKVKSIENKNSIDKEIVKLLNDISKKQGLSPKRDLEKVNEYKDVKQKDNVIEDKIINKLEEKDDPKEIDIEEIKLNTESGNLDLAAKLAEKFANNNYGKDPLPELRSFEVIEKFILDYNKEYGNIDDRTLMLNSVILAFNKYIPEELKDKKNISNQNLVNFGIGTGKDYIEKTFNLLYPEKFDKIEENKLKEIEKQAHLKKMQERKNLEEIENAKQTPIDDNLDSANKFAEEFVNKYYGESAPSQKLTKSEMFKQFFLDFDEKFNDAALRPNIWESAKKANNQINDIIKHEESDADFKKMFRATYLDHRLNQINKEEGKIPPNVNKEIALIKTKLGVKGFGKFGV